MTSSHTVHYLLASSFLLILYRAPRLFEPLLPQSGRTLVPCATQYVGPAECAERSSKHDLVPVVTRLSFQLWGIL